MAKDSLDEVFKKFGPITTDNSITEAGGAITIWLPTDYKSKYDMLQDKTKRKFSKLVREVLKSTIDRAEGSV